jgi:hypothetical protein
MGDQPQILLVDRRTWLLGGAATLALAACGKPHSERVVARDHRAFFLWPGVSPPRWLNHAKEVYVLAGEVRHQKDSAFVPLRAVPHVKGPALWLVVRVERLDWTDAIYAAVLHVLALWTTAGNRVLGLQIDFDSATRGLNRYATFLSDLRRRLPQAYRLSITGLLDWSAGGDPAALARLAGSVDDLVVQTYQGRRTIPGYEAYIAALRRTGIPYRLGLVEGGVWHEPSGVADDPNFRGYVVFLLGG